MAFAMTDLYPFMMAVFHLTNVLDFVQLRKS